MQGVAIGAGYFSQFHYEAWNRVVGVRLTALCDTDQEKAEARAREFNIPKVYTDVAEMLDTEQPDFLDIITPPATHLPFVRQAATRGIAVLCQKPLAPTWEEAVAVVETSEAHNIRLMVHENFRFQPWHRQVKQLLDIGTIGTLHAIAIRSRTGDGWQEDAYLNRQPYFRTMPRLLIYETGVHFLDLMRFYAGEVERVTAWLLRRNPAITGEDCAVLVAEMTKGTLISWNADRYAEPLTPDNPRLTFGDFLFEGSTGRITIATNGKIYHKPLGEPEREIDYSYFTDKGFGGDCVFATLTHFIHCLHTGKPFETEGRDYLHTLSALEAVYQSHMVKQPCRTKRVDNKPME